jgi:hypothetical protein
LPEFTHSDHPLRDHSQDLLGMTSHARTLAHIVSGIEPPYTIGIYGKWGEGKTSYANLLIEYLKLESAWTGMRLVEFSAWPYVTADTMWRAFLDRIAREILDQDKESGLPPNPQSPQAKAEAEVDVAGRAALKAGGQTEAELTEKAEAEARGNAEVEAGAKAEVGKKTKESPAPAESAPSWHGFLSNLLLTDVLTLRGEPVTAEKRRREQYERLRKRFDRSAAVAIRTPVEGGTGVNLAAFTGLVLSAAAALSPGIGTLRKVIGLGEGSVREIFSREEKSPPDVVLSVEELRADLRALFSCLEGGQPRLVIVLDDLDRCLPNVALDFLETIKVFFFESHGVHAPCLFIVAVDEGLIGRGLRMRIGEEPDVNTSEEARMYLEKIVQLRVPVPSPDDDRVHELVSASSPGWACATDLIGAGLGRNPRRIKQQCNLMAYRFMAQEEENEARKAGIVEQEEKNAPR